MLAFAELSQQRNNACIRIALCTKTQNLDEDSFDMLYKNNCWAAIPDPIWTTNVPYERQINILSSTDNNFMIFFYSHCIAQWIDTWDKILIEGGEMNVKRVL